MTRRLSLAARPLLLGIPLLCAAGRVLAQSTSTPAAGPSTQELVNPIERADDLNSKLTLGIYFFRPDGPAYDLNARHQFGHVTAWVAGFHDAAQGTLMRFGGQDDYKRAWVHLVLTGEASTDKAIVGSAYAELGADTVAIVGFSRTNLGNFLDLFFDPNDSVQLGIGHKISSYDRVQAYTIVDVRLNPGQQNTHVIWRHKLNTNNGITIDGLFKSGRTDAGEYVRSVGIGLYYDRPTWFGKVYYDPHVNFASRTMLRTGIGVKF